MSALAVADALEAALAIPVAPVFWAASDDADWMEAAVTHVATARGLEVARLIGPPTDGVAMADVPLGDLTEARAVLRAACGSAAHAGVMDVVDSAYVPHATIGAAYVQLLRALLEPLGIAVLDAAHPALRAAGDPLLRHALRHSAAVHQALAARTEAISAAGYAPQVDVVDGLSLVFRTQLTTTPDGVQSVRDRVPIAESAQVLREAELGSLGPNVLLRPVMERTILPTVCYLAGPGEYAYFAQVSAVATALAAPVPVASPRWAGELIESRWIDRQQQLGIDDAMLRDPHAAEQLLARRYLGDGLTDSIERLRVALDVQLSAVQEQAAGPEAPVAPEVVAGLSRDVHHKLDRFERRLLAGVKKREQEALREVAAMRAALRPGGASPERVLNLLPLLVRFGPAVLTAMRDAARAHASTLVHGGGTVESAEPVPST